MLNLTLKKPTFFRKACLLRQSHRNVHHKVRDHRETGRTAGALDQLTQNDMNSFFQDIRQVLDSEVPILNDMCFYYFDSTGKSIRPKIAFLMARACNKTAINCHSNNASEEQRKIAMIAEMIHTGSLMHDDVVDVSSMRRGKSTVNEIWGERNAVLAGNFVLSRSSHLLASIGNTEIVKHISTIIDDLVRGELMQISPSTTFDHYLKKTDRKTASLIANSCKSVALLSQLDPRGVEAMYQYGRNVGIAFQLIDDLLDFSQSAEDLGKPAHADLRLGLATAPVLFAAEKHPYLNDIILRRFNRTGDVEKTLKAVSDSDGLEETRLLARQYSVDAQRYLDYLMDSDEKEALWSMATAIVERIR